MNEHSSQILNESKSLSKQHKRDRYNISSIILRSTVVESRMLADKNAWKKFK